jgi:hypothetical protein
MLTLLQLAVAGSVTLSVASGDDFYRDRETFGVRYRTPALAGLTLQAGALAANENGLFPSKSGGAVRHWAAGLEGRVITVGRTILRASLIHGRLVEQRSEERSRLTSDRSALLPGTIYYTIWAVGAEVAWPRGSLTFERLVAVPVAVHVGLHRAILRIQTAPATVMVQLIESSADQPPYQFWTAEATVRPLWRQGAPWKWLGVQGGTRPVPSYTADRHVALTFLGVGVFWGGVLP